MGGKKKSRKEKRRKGGKWNFCLTDLTLTISMVKFSFFFFEKYLNWPFQVILATILKIGSKRMLIPNCREICSYV